jgi:DNA-binding GntR family transcriptional regulator
MFFKHGSILNPATIFVKGIYMSPMINKDCATPIYKQVVNILTENISSGKWRESDRIPSELELASSLGVSRGSIKKAVSELVDAGVLEQIQGKGTYVKPHDISFPLNEGLISFSESLREQGISFVTTILVSETLKADEKLASKLEIPIGSPYMHMERIRSVSGEPIMYIENNINCALVPNIGSEDFEKVSLFETIERLSGHKVAYSDTSFFAIGADEKRAKSLKVSLGQPMLQQIQTVFLDNNKPIEYARVWLRSNRFYVGTISQRRSAGRL